MLYTHGRDIKPQEEKKAKRSASKSAQKAPDTKAAAKPKVPAKTKAPASRAKYPSPTKVAKIEQEEKKIQEISFKIHPKSTSYKNRC